MLFSDNFDYQVRPAHSCACCGRCAPELAPTPIRCAVPMQHICPLQNVRREFITGVLSEEELGNKIFVHELGRNEYTERVANLRAYDAVSRLGMA
jgi:hypothetical protein